MGARTNWLAAMACGLIVLTGAARAAADCLPVPLTVLWSYPADGQTEVPLDATFWVLASQGELAPPVSATLNGEYVKSVGTRSDARVGQAAFRPEMLRPEQDYELRLIYNAADGTNYPFAVHFRTGTKRAGEAKAAIEAHKARSTAFIDEHPCKAVLELSGCFDSPDQKLSLHTFVAPSDNLIGWYVKAASSDPIRFWPAACGDPSIIEASAEADCYYLYGIDVRGEPATLTRSCGASQAASQPFTKESAPGYRGVMQPCAAPSGPDAAVSTVTSAPEPAPEESAAAKRDVKPESAGCGGCRVGGRSHVALSWLALGALGWLFRRAVRS